MDRRSFIKCAALPPLMLSHRTSWAGLADPDKDALSLEAQKTTWEIFKDKPATHIWSFDNNIFAKPIYAKQGEEVVIKVQNHLMENLGVHWHGIRLPNRMDGVPYLTQKPIMSKTGNFVYRFIANDAGTYWYHTHLNSMEQLERGLLGPLIIKEEKDYPVDEDWVMVLKDWRLTRAYQIDNRFYNRHDMVHNGRYGNVLTVNGKYVPTQEARPNARVRLRLINASNARIFVVDLSAFSQKTLVAIDGHPIIPRPYTSTYLAPGMRLDVIIDLIDKAKNYQILDQFDQPIKLFNVHLKNKPQRPNRFHQNSSHSLRILLLNQTLLKRSSIPFRLEEGLCRQG